MTARRKKPAWLFSTTVLVTLPVAYGASFGPAMWLSERSVWSRTPVALIHAPLLRSALDLDSYTFDGSPPPKIPALLRWWIRVGTKPGNWPAAENGRLSWHYCPGDNRSLGELW